jgi:hypothetical protein
MVALETGASSFGAFASLLLILVVAVVSKLGVDYFSRESLKKEAKFERGIKNKGTNQGLLGGGPYGEDEPAHEGRADSSELDIIIPQQ